MAIPIKVVPALKKSAAIRFDSNARASAKKITVDFTEEKLIAEKILKKSNLKLTV